jgi:hypothetical protein
MNLQQIISLPTRSHKFGFHYMLGDLVVASILTPQHRILLRATYGDDEHITRFSFVHSGPFAVIYQEPFALPIQTQLTSQLGVIAMMSAVTFADINFVGDQSVIHIAPTQINQYDVGDPKKYALVRALICHHTQESWDDGFLVDQYRQHRLLLADLLNRLHSSP